jgi:hypothetical protein
MCVDCLIRPTQSMLTLLAAGAVGICVPESQQQRRVRLRRVVQCLKVIAAGNCVRSVRERGLLTQKIKQSTAHGLSCRGLMGLTPLGLLKTTWQLLHTLTGKKKDSSGIACFLFVHFLRRRIRLTRGSASDFKTKTHAQKTLPQFLQWCFRSTRLNFTRHSLHLRLQSMHQRKGHYSPKINGAAKKRANAL